MGYDIENRLTTLSYNDGTQDHRVEYTYGANSFVHIIQKYVDDVLTEETRLVRDGYLIVQERDGSNTALRSYVWSSSALGGIGALTAMVQNSQVYYYLFDGRGNVASVVDESANRVARYVYDAFGELRSVTGSLEQPFRFSTKYYDAGTGLVDFGYRFYVADTGRWLNRDPIGVEGGINLYTYVLNDPINFYDPYGLFGVVDFPTIPQPIVDMTAGFGDTLSFGFTDWVRDQIDTNSAVDKCSDAYSGGEYAGYSWGAATGIGVAGRALQVEVNILSKGNVFKIISKRSKMGFRVDPAHHGKPWGHMHRWRW